MQWRDIGLTRLLFCELTSIPGNFSLAFRTDQIPTPSPNSRKPPLRRSQRSKYYVIIGRERLKTKLVQIGNSRGIRLPKTVIEEAQLADEIELKVEPGCIFIRSATRPRMGWPEAARKMRERGDDQLLDLGKSTTFDREEWEWR